MAWKRLNTKQECGGACMSAWGHGDKLTLTSYQRRAMGWKSRGLHRLADEGSERKLSRLLSVCLCFIINIRTWRGAANYHSAEREKNCLKEMTSEKCKLRWTEIKPGGFFTVQKQWRQLISCPKCVTMSYQKFFKWFTLTKNKRWAVTLTLLLMTLWRLVVVFLKKIHFETRFSFVVEDQLWQVIQPNARLFIYFFSWVQSQHASNNTTSCLISFLDSKFRLLMPTNLSECSVSPH